MKKNFTMGVLGCALWLAAALSQAAPSGPTPPVTLSPDAPDTYTVVKGDTLWDISARFLKSPWQWPQIWQLNREQIANPHLIYPGDIVYLDRSGAQPRLRLGRVVGTGNSGAPSGTEPTVRLQPRVRPGELRGESVPTLNLTAVQHFLNRPLIVEAEGLRDHPRIVATQDGRLYLGRGDLAYVRGVPDASVSDWHVYRPARPLLDPVTRQPIAWETLFVGSAQMIRDGDPSTFRILANNEEIGEGDRLMPATSAALPALVPRPPEQLIEGRIVSVYRGIDAVGKHSVVALSVGAQQGLEIGHVLAVQTTGRTITDRELRQPVKLPNESIGQVVIFRLFDRIAYGLVVAATEPISVGATVVNP
jgi:hypothetical protein